MPRVHAKRSQGIYHSFGTIRIFPGIYTHTHDTHTHTHTNIRIHIHDTLLSPFDDVHKRVKRVFEESSRQIIQRKRAQARKQNFDNELSYRSLSIVNASQRKKKKKKVIFPTVRGGKSLWNFRLELAMEYN